MKMTNWTAATALALGAGFIFSPAPARAGGTTEFNDAAAAIRSVVLQQARSNAADRALLQGRKGALLRDLSTVVSVALNSKTVKCSRADYAEPQLKVLIPALAELTVLNHRNTREGAPCVAAGPCAALNPQDILKPGEGTEQIPVRVVLKKVTELDGEVCRVFLNETVKTVIRGVPFFHERQYTVEERVAEDCR